MVSDWQVGTPHDPKPKPVTAPGWTVGMDLNWHAGKPTNPEPYDAYYDKYFDTVFVYADDDWMQITRTDTKRV
jgi:hypothetical protein